LNLNLLNWIWIFWIEFEYFELNLKLLNWIWIFWIELESFELNLNLSNWIWIFWIELYELWSIFFVCTILIEISKCKLFFFYPNHTLVIFQRSRHDFECDDIVILLTWSSSNLNAPYFHLRDLVSIAQKILYF